jgi:DNA polymerase (family X)
MASHDKPKIPLAAAKEKALDLVEILLPHSEKIQIAGSIRRQKATVGDIEILYIPKQGNAQRPGEFLPSPCEDLVEIRVLELIAEAKIKLRPKSDGTHSFGPKVKLLQLLPCGTPVDLFRCTQDSWANNLLSRTGGKEHNIHLASTALRMGLEWIPFGPGFRRQDTGEILPVKKEEDAFALLGLPYLHPEERH